MRRIREHKKSKSNAPNVSAVRQLLAGVNIFGIVVEHVVEGLSFWDELAHAFGKVAPHIRSTPALQDSAAAQARGANAGKNALVS